MSRGVDLQLPAHLEGPALGFTPAEAYGVAGSGLHATEQIGENHALAF